MFALEPWDSFHCASAVSIAYNIEPMMCCRVFIGKCHRPKNESHQSEWLKATSLFRSPPFVLSCIQWLTSHSHSVSNSLSLCSCSPGRVWLQAVLCTSGTDWLIWGRQTESVYSPGPGQERIHRGGGAEVRTVVCCCPCTFSLRGGNRPHWIN